MLYDDSKVVAFWCSSSHSLATLFFLLSALGLLAALCIHLGCYRVAKMHRML